MSIDWKNPNANVSKYFTVKEVTQNDPRRIPTDPKVIANIIKLAQKLDIVREAWGSSIAVNSWYRPPAINKAVGGVSNSQHINGGAVDIRPSNGQGIKFENWLDTTAWANNALGYGQRAGKGFTHVDLRLGKIRWNY